MCVRMCFNQTPVFNVGFTFCIITLGFKKKKVVHYFSTELLPWLTFSLSSAYCNAQLNSTITRFLCKEYAYSVETMH